MTTNNRLQLLGAWCGIAFIAVFALGWVGFARWLPPPSPNLSAQEMAEVFKGNLTGIRVGMLLGMFSAAFLVPFAAAIALQIRRIEGRIGILTLTQFGLGTLLALGVVFPVMFWEAAAFRPDDAQFVQHFYDLAMLPFLAVCSGAIMQNLIFAIATFIDKRPQPVFPRWFAYANLWLATLYTPGAFCVFFKTGPLAWDGLLAWWVVSFAFLGWLTMVSIMCIKAIRRQARDGEPDELTNVELAAELAALRSRLDAPGVDRSTASV